ncbi:antibiotic biosynthesis monooxygenase [Lutibacter sp. TH_r2]|uniref:antibiotic biosynthesis monooxygenase family protein n=1 Tax=Lutibacter sp. TH_r2 TaxID=3082083 RepID=UPI002952B2E1|nr:antibiotic biosynthesis monooxygenase [Lutibacter sp. TH_r2]MDV7188193.1 antibiotic biosynthesis monooxygenase [Lutibacter sp. TH_r2]
MIAKTTKPPYYAVIFTSERTKNNNGYSKTAIRMEELAKKEAGFLGMEAARSELGITVSYWNSLEAIQHWKENVAHSEAREKGRSDWYKAFKVRICKVEKEYGFEK